MNSTDSEQNPAMTKDLKLTVQLMQILNRYQKAQNELQAVTKEFQESANPERDCYRVTHYYARGH